MAFPVDVKYINEFESEIGLKLPSAYKKGLTVTNGGEIDNASDLWQVFPVFDKSNRKRISRTSNHIIRETKSAKEWQGFPQEAIAVASNGYGDFAILIPDKFNTEYFEDKVYMWLHETPGTDKIFYTTGRLTSEMVMKVAQMGISVLLSRSGITQMGLDIAKQIGVTLIARAKGKHFLIYNGQQHIEFDAVPQSLPKSDKRNNKH